MSSENLAILMGNLGADPELRYTQNNTAVANIRLATNEAYRTADGDIQETTEWHRLVLWGKLAETASRYLKKGSRVYVSGKLQTRSWEDKDGTKHYTTEINVGKLKFVDRVQKDGDGGGKPAGPDSKDAAGAPEDDDDLPF